MPGDVSGTSWPGLSSAIRPVRCSSVSGTCCGPRPAAHSDLPKAWRNTGVEATVAAVGVEQAHVADVDASGCRPSLRSLAVSTRSPGSVGCVNDLGVAGPGERAGAIGAAEARQGDEDRHGERGEAEQGDGAAAVEGLAARRGGAWR